MPSPSRELRRLLPRLHTALAACIAADPSGWQAFLRRLETRFPALFALYFDLYGARYDFLYHLEELLLTMARAWFERPADLRALDESREQNPAWFQSNHMLGGVIYVDLFAGDLEGVRARIPYFRELGLTYLHLMPFFKMPSGENDGGYAVSDYRQVHPPLGTMEQLATLARDLRAAGISLVADLVFNHTSNEHPWAQAALAGDEDARELYFFFPDRSLPDQYERTLREIFPEEHPGAFSPLPPAKGVEAAPQRGTTANAPLPPGEGVGVRDTGWVWTTFHTYQWDLNYANPNTFNRMAGEMLFLANQGVEILRLDAVAFIWKQMGTNCENLPQAHTLIRAFNAVARIAAPALLFKSEAIVHPDEVARYIHPQECQLSYNPLLMALLWNALATRKVRLLSQALASRFAIHPETAWVNYVRCHDDIGWTFADEDAAILGVNGFDHRRFLNEFYRGRFPGSFARGLPFQENPKTGDCRISGTCASLAGLEKALTEEGPNEVELAIRRILLIHCIILTVGGIPLLYLGDEIGTLNDYSYQNDPAKAADSRWVHRPRADWERYARRHDPQTLEGRIYSGLKQLIQLRKENEVFSGHDLRLLETGNVHVLGYERRFAGRRALLFANFSEQEQSLSPNAPLSADLVSMRPLYGQLHLSPTGALSLPPLGFVVLM
ncbi:MAG: alpha-amylase family glycosyl hydrolase [Anaerolineales bacterium]|nr:alpha-amylase family glycosyl hydrolase [Anaerolineales bacterium]